MRRRLSAARYHDCASELIFSGARLQVLSQRDLNDNVVGISIHSLLGLLQKIPLVKRPEIFATDVRLPVECFCSVRRVLEAGCGARFVAS